MESFKVEKLCERFDIGYNVMGHLEICFPHLNPYEAI